jgi:hypothetical protein
MSELEFIELKNSLNLPAYVVFLNLRILIAWRKVRIVKK